MIEQELQSVSDYQKKSTTESPQNTNYENIDIEKQINIQADQEQTAESLRSSSINDQIKQKEKNKLINKKFDNNEEEEEYQLKNNRYFGNNFVWCFYKQEPLFSLGPHWPMVICTSCLFGFSGYAITQYVAIKKGDILYYGEMMSTILLLFFYLLTAFVNPGIQTAKNHTDKLKNLIGYCSICKVKSSQETYHCYDCDVCIKGYDHHCPWTGKCIGEGNLTFFKIFIFLLCFFFVFSMVVAVARIG